MSRGERKAMIARDRPGLSLAANGLLTIGRSSFYYAPKGESPVNLADARTTSCFSSIRFMAAARWSVRAARRRPRRSSPGSASHAIDGPTGDLPSAENQRSPPVASGLSLSAQGLAIERPNRSGAPTSPTSRSGADSVLVAIMDWATRHVLAWRLSNTMDASFCVEALAEALGRTAGRRSSTPTRAASSPAATSPARSRTRMWRSPWSGLHGQHLHRAAVAVAEIRGGLPHELTDGFAAERVIGEFDFYNTERPHSSLGGQTPAEAYGAGQPVDMMDKPDGLPTSPQAQQQQQDVRFWQHDQEPEYTLTAAKLSNNVGPAQSLMRFSMSPRGQ